VSGPYIVTIKRVYSIGTDHGVGESRRAVATLDEAHEYVWNLLDSDPATDQTKVSLAESGGTVGPLPDGTVIEVAPATWRDLAAQASLDIAWVASADTDEAEIIDAYNAEQEAT
jgi:hypothetical protein